MSEAFLQGSNAYKQVKSFTQSECTWENNRRTWFFPVGITWGKIIGFGGQSYAGDVGRQGSLYKTSATTVRFSVAAQNADIVLALTDTSIVVPSFVHSAAYIMYFTAYYV